MISFSLYILWNKKSIDVTMFSNFNRKGLKSSAKWYEVDIVLSFLLSDKWKFTQHNI